MRIITYGFLVRGSRVMSRRAASSLHPSIPSSPVSSKFAKSEKKTVIDQDTIEHLERISLVDFANVRGIERLEEAIELANIITKVDTTNVEPLYSILEDEALYLRPDVPEPPNNRKELLKLSTMTEEDYFVAPQGNVPLSIQKQYDRDNK